MTIRHEVLVGIADYLNRMSNIIYKLSRKSFISRRDEEAYRDLVINYFSLACLLLKRKDAKRIKELIDKNFDNLDKDVWTKILLEISIALNKSMQKILVVLDESGEERITYFDELEVEEE